MLSPFVCWLIFIEYLETIRGESIDGIDLCGRRRSLKPTGRTPWIGIGGERQPMLHGILMHIIQAGKVGFFVGDPISHKSCDLPLTRLSQGFTDLSMCNPAAGRGTLKRELLQPHPKVAGGVGRRVTDEVIVI
jgi:hypothetical protein